MKQFHNNVNAKTQETNRKQQIQCWIVWEVLETGMKMMLIRVDLYRRMKYNYHNCRIMKNPDWRRVKMVQLHAPERIIQEQVPGKEITIAHLIASPDITLYEKLGLDPRVEHSKSAIGVLTISPSETAIIAGDIAIKAAGIELGFVDRFSGTLIVTGTISETEAAIRAVLEYVKDKMGFSVCEITRT